MSRVHLALLAALVAALIGMVAVMVRASTGGDGPRPAAEAAVEEAAPATAEPATTATGSAATESAAATAPEAAATTGDGERLVLPRPLPDRTLDVPILMYHRIARQMAWLADAGYASITQRQLFAALMEGAPLPERPVLITFDDGYREIAETAAPIMARHGLTGTAYVITDRILADPAAAPLWMTEDQLRDLAAAGWDIGSHTVTHQELTLVDEATALRELRASRFRLERILGRPVQWFCYPVGEYDTASEGLVRRAGYVLAVTTDEGTLQRADQPLLLQRVRVSDDTGVAGLRARLGG
ncbi:MAG: polysaccharide deacetylase family protein [Actinomycetota bacterium]